MTVEAAERLKTIWSSGYGQEVTNVDDAVNFVSHPELLAEHGIEEITFDEALVIAGIVFKYDPRKIDTPENVQSHLELRQNILLSGITQDPRYIALDGLTRQLVLQRKDLGFY